MICGHLGSTRLPDGSILTGHGNDFTGGALIRRKPSGGLVILPHG